LNKKNENESWYSRGKAEADKGIPYNERVVGIAIVRARAFIQDPIIVYCACVFLSKVTNVNVCL